MSFPVPHDRFKGKVKPEWIDQNGHMNRFRCKESILAVDRAGEDEMTRQATPWRSPVMNSAWALLSSPSALRTCPFLIIAIAS